MTLGVLLCQRQTQQARRSVDRQLLRCNLALSGNRRLRPTLRRTGNQHNQIALFHPSLLRNRRRRFRKLVPNALEIFEHFRAALGVEHGLDVVTIFA